MGEVPNSASALLCEFLRADNEVGSERSLALLFSNYAEPQVRRMLRRKMSLMGVVERQDLEDVCNHVLLELLRYLRQLSLDRDKRPIEDFAAFTSATVYRAYSDYLRRKYPRRHRLKAQLRQMFRNDNRLEIFKTEKNEWVCRLQKTQGSEKVSSIQDMRAMSAEFQRGSRPPNAAEFVTQFLKRAGPVELDDLVGVVAELWGIRDMLAADLEEAGRLVSPSNESDVIDVRRRLEKLWTQVCALPVRQRHALLLNLRDGSRGSALTLLPAMGIASVLGIAAVLEIPNTELRALWHELPLDDQEIARRLGIQRQQVINLRKAARARLARRMG